MVPQLLPSENSINSSVLSTDSLPEGQPYFISFIQPVLTLEGRIANLVNLGIRSYNPSSGELFGNIKLLKYSFPFYATTGVTEQSALSRVEEYRQSVTKHLFDSKLDITIENPQEAIRIEPDFDFPARLYSPLISSRLVKDVFPQSHILARSLQVRNFFGSRYTLVSRLGNRLVPTQQSISGSDLVNSRIMSWDIEVTDYNLPDLSDSEKKFSTKQLCAMYEELCAINVITPEKLGKEELLLDIRRLRNGGLQESLASLCFGDSAVQDAIKCVIPQYFSRLDSRDFLMESLVYVKRANPMILISHNGLVYDNDKLNELEKAGFGFFQTRFLSATKGHSIYNYHQVGLQELDTCGFSRNFVPGLLNYRLSTVGSAILNQPVKKSLSHAELESHLQQARAGNTDSKNIVDKYATTDIMITHPLGMALLPFAARLAVATDNSLARLSSSARSTIAFDYHAQKYEREKRRSFFARNMRVQVLTAHNTLAAPQLPSEFDAKEYVKSFVPIKSDMRFGDYHLVQTAPFYKAAFSLFKDQTKFKELIDFVRTDNTTLNKSMFLEFFDSLGELPVLTAFRYSDTNTDTHMDEKGSIIRRLAKVRKKDTSSSSTFANLFCLPVGNTPKNVLRRLEKAIVEIADLAQRHGAVAYDGRFMLLQSLPQNLPTGTQHIGTGPFVVYDNSSYVGRTGFAVRKSGVFDFTSARCELSKFEKEIFNNTYDALFSLEDKRLATHNALCIIHDGAMRIRDQCLDGKTGDEKVDFALRRVLTHNASEYKSKLRWVVEAQRLGLHKGDEVAYRTSSRDQLAEIIGLPEYSSKKVLPKSSQFAEVQGSLHGIEEAYLTTKTKEVLEFNQDATFYRLAKAISGHSDVSLHSFFSKQKSRDEIRTYSQIVAAQQFSL